MVLTVQVSGRRGVIVLILEDAIGKRLDGIVPLAWVLEDAVLVERVLDEGDCGCMKLEVVFAGKDAQCRLSECCGGSLLLGVVQAGCIW